MRNLAKALRSARVFPGFFKRATARFSALRSDAHSRRMEAARRGVLRAACNRLRRWLRALHDRTGLTTVFVTHDQEEALELADRVAILNRGRIEQLGSPADAYDAPASPFVYSFVGAVNRVPGRWEAGALQVAGLPLQPRGDAGDGEAEVYVRPEDLHLVDAAGLPAWPAMIVDAQRTGPRLRLRARLADSGAEVDVDLPADREGPATLPGQPVRLAPKRFGWFPRNGAPAPA